MSKKNSYYTTNKEMVKELRKYKKSGVISEELGGMFITIATNYANKGNFIGYSWKNDMIGEAVYTCIRYIHNFDINKQKEPNPFAYFTQICYHSFLNYIKKQKRHSKIKDVCFNNSHIILDNNQYKYMTKSINYEDLK